MHKDELPILRLKNGKTFEYLLNNRPLAKQDELQRIKELVIPPAWENVQISDLSNAHLQAFGYDLKKRIQYRYHPLWLKIRNRTKFYRMSAFGNVLPELRSKVEADLALHGWPRNKVLALVVRLMEETHIRIGSRQYAKRNKTYGLSTLRTKHVSVHKEKVRFKFTGKKGKKHDITLRNKKLITLVSKCEEIPGWELFQFFDKDGNKTAIDSGMVNDYIQQAVGDAFTAKDFRTWAGTVIFFDSLRSFPKTCDPKILHSNTLRAYDVVAKELGNTRNVCRKYYVHPLLPLEYEKGNLIEAFENVDTTTHSPNQSASEAVLLRLIQEYSPLQDIKKNIA